MEIDESSFAIQTLSNQFAETASDRCIFGWDVVTRVPGGGVHFGMDLLLFLTAFGISKRFG